MDTFKGQDNDEMKPLSTKNNCELIIVSQTLSNKFQPLDISLIRQQKNSFTTNSTHGMLIQCANGIANGDVKVSLQVCDLQPPQAKRTGLDLRKQNDSIIKGFDAAGITGAIKCANNVFTGVKNPFDEHRQQPL